MDNKPIFTDNDNLYIFNHEGRPLRIFPIQGSNIIADPVTVISWSYVAKVLGESALKWMAGKILDSIFKNTQMSNQDLINLMVREVRATLQTVLAEYDLRLLTREYTALLMGMEEYGRNGGVHRLDNADVKVNYLMAALREYGIITNDLYVGAVALKVSIYQAYIVDKHRDETDNLKIFAQNQFKILSNNNNLIENEIEKMYSGHDFRAIWISNDGIYEIGYDVNNRFVLVTICYPKDDTCMSNARDQVQKERNLSITNTKKVKLESIQAMLTTLSDF